jgi:hypothetical protein
MHLDCDDAGMALRDHLESSPTLRERIFDVVDQAATPALSRLGVTISAASSAAP